MIEKRFKITNEYGLHARPATQLVQLVNEFTSNIKLTVAKTTVDFKSIMGVMSLGAYKGEIMDVVISGDDEEKAMNELSFMISDIKLGKEI